jgi:hypothetical protein
MSAKFFRAVAYSLFLVAALLVGALLLWVYRMVAVRGSVLAAWQIAISLGWSAFTFVTITVVGAALCFCVAMSLLSDEHDQH